MIPQKLFSNRTCAVVSDSFPSTSIATIQHCSSQRMKKPQLNECLTEDHQHRLVFSSFQTLKHLFKTFGKKAENFFGIPPKGIYRIDPTDPDADIRRARRHLRYISRNYGGFSHKQLIKALKRQNFFERHSCAKLAADFEEFMDPEEFSTLATQLNM